MGLLMNTLRDAVIAGLIVMASIYAMGCTNMQIEQRTAYQAIRGGK